MHRLLKSKEIDQFRKVSISRFSHFVLIIVNKMLAPNKADKRIASELYRCFSQKQGSQYIATQSAMEWLSACMRIFKPRQVLELGPGIGTLTELMLNHYVNIERLVAAENNQFCLSVLRKNLSLGDDPRLAIVTTPSELAALNFSADMIVGDGGFYSEEELSTAHAGTVIFVEGVRPKLRAAILNNCMLRGLSIEFDRFGGTIPKIKFGFSRRFGIPIPVPHRSFKGGAYIGVIEENSRVTSFSRP